MILDIYKMLKKSEIHNKVWGREEWVVNAEEYCGKILNINEGYRCSIHYHKAKDETFYLLSGRVLMEINGTPKVMGEGDIQRILPSTKHRFSGLENSVVIEFSTHHEETDSYRDTQSEKIPEEEFRELLKKFNAIK